MGIFFELLTRPLLNFLILIFEAIPDFGVAIIIFTVAIRVVLFPLNQRALSSQRELQALGPKIKALQKKYKDNKEKQASETMALYKLHQINPFTGFLAILVQLPIFIALFQVLRNDFTTNLASALYSFVPDPGIINQTFLGTLDLSSASLSLALIAGLTQFIQAKISTRSMPKQSKKGGKDRDFSGIMQKQMLYFFPIFTAFIAFSFPAGLALYWATSNVLGSIQQWVLLRQKPVLEHDHG